MDGGLVERKLARHRSNGESSYFAWQNTIMSPVPQYPLIARVDIILEQLTSRLGLPAEEMFNNCMAVWQNGILLRRERVRRGRQSGRTATVPESC